MEPEASSSVAQSNGSGGAAPASCSSSIVGNSRERTTCSGIGGDLKVEGNIKLVISNLSQLRHKVTTSYHTIANLPWRLAAKTESSKRTNNVKYFSVYIDCNPESESTLWCCEAIVQFKLHSQSDDVTDFTRQFSNKFNFNSNNWGFPSFIEWNDILSIEKGYIKNDRVIVEAHITVQKTRGVRLSPSFDFYQSHHCSDGVVVIDGVRLHVSKPYLALYSPVFSALFYGEFRERDMEEVPLEDVIIEEFNELLQVIYPSHKKVTAENVEFLLELGDKFEVQYVIDECERFLTGTEEIPIITKLVWADQYQLSRLQDVCIRTFKTTTEIKNLKTLDEYKNLSDTTKSALLEKMFKLM